MYQFTIPGRPRPKQRPRLGYRGKEIFRYTPAETREYERTVGLIANVKCGQPLKGPVEVRIVAYFKGKNTPDLDNVIKAILDGIAGAAYDNDRQVKRIVAEERPVRAKKEERAEVEILAWEEEAG